MNTNDETLANGIGAEEPDPDYPTLFKRYIVHSVQTTLASLPAEMAQNWEAARERALHVLGFGLAWAEAWPATRDLLLLLAPKMEQAGHRDDWLPYLERGVVLSRQQNDRRAEAELTLAVGELLRLRSKFALARAQVETSIALFTALGLAPRQAHALNELAFVAWQQHQYDEAETLAQSALLMLEENDPERATCFSRLGLVAIDRQQWAVAERYHRQAIQIRQAQGDQRKFAWSLQNLGYALRGQQKFSDAINSYEKAITILEDMQDIGNCANTRVNLGIVYWLAEQPRRALDEYTVAESILGKLHDIHNLAAVVNNKGLCYLALQEWKQAEDAFLSSIHLFQQIGDLNLRLNVLDGLGLAYLGQNQYDRARFTFQSALDELPQIAGTPMFDYLASVLPMHIAEALKKANDSSILCSV